ncbi:argininosuccinate lyase [Scopulibacillus daqui]|uniref:Argininosuccinate lyase n=1 Tax=Scopulibacillus daqui TaxID=1469162 RepID=A0ABS2Q1N3_9BACL|nr:argininosuccinate lyase [Scopulibacillus daqui]MBM7646190.1 argininosuccinate lyase [Scopulibacillus daqui]
MLNPDDFIKTEGSAFPGRTYIDELLKPIFYDQRNHLTDAMFSLHRAHVVMLREQQLLSASDTRDILGGLEKLTSVNWQAVEYDPNYEDLFFMMEAKLGELIGGDLAGKMHMARSRNDMGEGMYRLVARKYLLALIRDVNRLSESLLDQAEKHIETVMPAHTHTQPAQPTTFGHYLVAVFDHLHRDEKRLWAAYQTVNQSPLGAAAMTTTGFPISRERVAELLGFKGLVENSFDAIATGDYLIEAAISIACLMINTGRWIQEFLRFSTKEAGLLHVADPYVQISSIMPQKRNPVSVEHSRALASSAVGEAMAVIQMLHNTPYGDIVDSEDDLQPHLYKSCHKASRTLRLMNAVVQTMSIDVDHAAKEAGNHLITITELADVLTRDHGLPFRKAHGIASKIAKKSAEEHKELYEWQADDINEILDGVKLSKEEWQGIIDPSVFVKRRSIRGGPCPSEVKRMIDNRRLKINKRVNRYIETKKALMNAEGLLRNCVTLYMK